MFIVHDCAIINSGMCNTREIFIEVFFTFSLSLRFGLHRIFFRAANNVIPIN